MQSSIVLRCLAEHDEPDSWFVICLDLNVYARAGSYEQARRCLHEEITHYLNDAYTVDREHFSQLVPRRAPLRFWLKYGIAKLRSVPRANDPDKRRFRETVPLTLAPC